MRVAIYTRVSTKDAATAEARQTTENQILQLEAFAKTQGWTITHRYEDRKSGKNTDREQFQAMFAAASRREFDILLFWSLDRLSREGVVPTLHHLQRLTGYGVGYRSYTEQYLDTCGIFKDAVIAILATIAKQERMRISERIKAGLERATKAGRKAGQPLKKLDEKKIAALAREGKGSRKIAAALKQPEATIRRRMKQMGIYYADRAAAPGNGNRESAGTLR
jgi:DNA invertase Pin-like site-specific DNA recombinase